MFIIAWSDNQTAYVFSKDRLHAQMILLYSKLGKRMSKFEWHEIPTWLCFKLRVCVYACVNATSLQFKIRISVNVRVILCCKIWVIGNHPAVVQSFRWSIVWDNYIGCVIASSIAHIVIIVHDSLCIVKLRTSFGITAKAILPYMVCLDCVVRTDHVSCFE